MTYGMGVTAILFAIAWAALAKTAWGRHVYAIGDDPESARLTGINVRVNLVSVYVVAGINLRLCSLDRHGPHANRDPNAYQTGNLDSITAVVIGGTSLFGGRGGVAGTIIGALIVAVLRSGPHADGYRLELSESGDRCPRHRRGRFRPTDTPENVMITASDTAGPAIGPDTDPVLSGSGPCQAVWKRHRIRGSDFDLFSGEVLAIVGDNGAGKSSLIKALTGALIPDAGTITLNGEGIRFGSPADARNRGIETVYQTLAVSPALDIATKSFSWPRNPSRGLLGDSTYSTAMHANPGKGTTRRARHRHRSGHHSAGGKSFRWATASCRRRACRDVRKECW